MTFIRNGVVMTNVDGDNDTTFDCEVGSWNVTRAWRDCLEGKHPIVTFDVAGPLAACPLIVVDEAKIARIVADRQRLLASPPMVTVRAGAVFYLIDGWHRLHALSRIGVRIWRAFDIVDDAAYRITFNGERVAPPWLRPTLFGRAGR